MPPTHDALPIQSMSRSRDRSRGQVAVIFALSIVLFVALCAVVVDVAFYWVTTLKVQRAADAAALAGAVYLPGDRTSAYAEARASATQNDYTGSGAITVTPVQDTGDPRQLDVTIAASSPAFFARVLGITSYPVTRSAKGIYVLPVPMGSPLAYYGVGDFSVNQTSPVVTPGLTGNSGARAATATPSSVWTQNSGTLVSAVNAADSAYAYTTTNTQAQQWSTFGLLTNLAANEAITSVDGIQVKLTNVKVSATCASTTIAVALSGDNGNTWTTGTQVTGNLTTSNQTFTFGATTNMTAWPGQAWNSLTAPLSDGKFRLRLTAAKGCATTGTQLRVDQISIQANYTFSRTTMVTTMVTTHGVTDGTFLTSQGGWGAIITRGGDQGNGDAYAPDNDGTGANLKFNANGYDYAVNLPSGGIIKVFDPGFCAMGSNGVGGSMGVGDHWIVPTAQVPSTATGTQAPVSTYYTVWDSNGNLGLPSSWSQIYTSGALFEGQTGYDPSNMGPNGTGSAPANATSGCDAYHNAWWTVPTGNLGGGTYVLQVQTSKTRPPSGSTDASVNNGTSAENMWAIEAVGGGSPQVYGNGRMTVYNNLPYDSAVGGTQTQQFYLAKIDQATGAGKTALIDLFDPGDLAGGATGTLRVFSPDGGTSHAVNFSYTTEGHCTPYTGTSACSGTNVGSITTTSPSGQATNNTWIHISVPLDGTYGQTGLWQGGWWQIQYTIDKGGNDTTTWEVSVSGNPVHLLVP